MVAHEDMVPAPKASNGKAAMSLDALIALAERVGRDSLAPNAARWDREGTFPTASYDALRQAGLLGLVVPAAHGGLGADFATYMQTVPHLSKYCATTALTFNMHCGCMMLTGFVFDSFDLPLEIKMQHQRRQKMHFERAARQGKVYALPFSEIGLDPSQALFSTTAKRVEGGWIVNGKKVFASLAGHADYYGVSCTEIADGKQPDFGDIVMLSIASNSPGVSVAGEWDTLGMRGTNSRTLLFKDVFVPENEILMPHGSAFQSRKVWPHLYMQLTCTYMGLAEAIFDFVVSYLRGEVPGMPPIKRRNIAQKQIDTAHLRIKLESARANWLRAIKEAGPNPSNEALQRMYVAQYTVMEGAAQIGFEAIRICGGSALQKSLPLERMFRDARCGSLMLPYTADISVANLGRACLYAEGETD
ncbi:acyl-CoA dehydrogenase family protein [Ferrovibrio sp.]|uniref:acyl-CoA dehydrogenase family protein n=1 Tax=Ferrovibrio sp. TaxID=1917215 RepID=UPI0025BCF7E8|nr:acyl-CoA dehydrogenase family protein [Ferrovibrio sp.]MBX3452942.1 acyl-CoA/acyl-ACP dehydrogenase [Ferrovibrio sp.]